MGEKRVGPDEPFRAAGEGRWVGEVTDPVFFFVLPLKDFPGVEGELFLNGR